MKNVSDATSPPEARHRRPAFILQGILPFDRSRLGPDVIAGITLAALGIPEVMGYTKIAGMPVITGLYTILIPISVFAILGSSRHLVVGADSATAAIMAAGLAGLAPIASPQYVQLAGVLAILTGGFLILARVIRLGFLADFLSRSVLIGFLTGVGIQVAMGQVAGMLGVPGGSTGGTVQKFFETLGQIPQTSLTTLAVSVSVLGVILVLRVINRSIPGALIAVIGAIWASYAFNLQAHGVAVLGPVPSGLPNFGFPSGWDQWATLLSAAGSMFLVILAQSAATSRAYAAKYDERFDENMDLVGLSLANVSAGLSGTFVVNGSPTKTQMVDGAGGRSQVAQITTSVIVLIVLLFLTVPLSYMPSAVLASIVFMIGVELVDIPGMRLILRWRVDEFVVAAITAVVVVTVGVEQGIILAIVLSVIDHLRVGYHPHDTYVTFTAAGGRRSAPVADDAPVVEAEPGIVVYRFASNLYYANANRFVEEIRGTLTADPPPVWICLDAGGVGDIDFTGGQAVLDLYRELDERGVRLVVADISDLVRARLDRYGVSQVTGEQALFGTVEDAIRAFREGQGGEGR
jgi:SulP family sulfate permease